MTKVISIANQKGGVGKTTCSINLGGALAERGYRVLCVDMDPQANLTVGLGVSLSDVRQSMANGGGPACLRLRVVADPDTVDPRFLVDGAKLDRIADVVERRWPVQIRSDELQEPALVGDVEAARAALLEAIDLAELL